MNDKKTLEVIDNRITEFMTAKSLVCKLSDWVEALNWDIEYHKKNIDDTNPECYHRREYEALKKEQTIREAMKKCCENSIIFEFNI